MNRSPKNYGLVWTMRFARTVPISEHPQEFSKFISVSAQLIGTEFCFLWSQNFKIPQNFQKSCILPKYKIFTHVTYSTNSTIILGSKIFSSIQNRKNRKLRKTCSRNSGQIANTADIPNIGKISIGHRRIPFFQNLGQRVCRKYFSFFVVFSLFWMKIIFTFILHRHWTYFLWVKHWKFRKIYP